MPAVWICDGCECRIPAHTHDALVDPATCPGCQNGHDGLVVGRLDPAHYCRDCAARWQAHEAAVRAERVEAIRAVEVFIRDAETKLKTTLRRLPD